MVMNVKAKDVAKAILRGNCTVYTRGKHLVVREGNAVIYVADTMGEVAELLNAICDEVENFIPLEQLHEYVRDYYGVEL